MLEAVGMLDAERVRHVRKRVFADAAAARPGSAEAVFPTAIGLREGLALRDCVRRERVRATFETGLGYGISTLFICEGLLANGTDGRHVAVDPFQFEGPGGHGSAFAGAGLALIEEAGLDEIVEFYPEGSELVLPRLLAEGRRFDLAFLDGNHRFEGVFLDLVYSGRLLKEGGIVFADDTQLTGVRRAIEFCLANLDWTVEDTGAEGSLHEWMVLRTGPSDVFTRPFQLFVDFQAPGRIVRDC
jgi:predicted O-methyltransferase YrrM